MRKRVVIVALLGLMVAIAVTACGAGLATTTTFAPGSLGTAAQSTTSVPSAAPSPTDITVPLTTAGSDQTAPTDPNKPTTPVFTGTTLPGGGQMFTLTFVGPMTADTWKAVRAAVNSAHDNGDEVRVNVAKLSAGPDASINSTEFDRFSGIGFTAGANTTQPVAMAAGADGQQILVYSFTITGKADATTIVGFDLGTGHVGLVEGPLKVTDKTKNITTVPGQ